MGDGRDEQDPPASELKGWLARWRAGHRRRLLREARVRDSERKLKIVSTERHGTSGGHTSPF